MVRSTLLRLSIYSCPSEDMGPSAQIYALSIVLSIFNGEIEVSDQMGGLTMNQYIEIYRNPLLILANSICNYCPELHGTLFV